MDLTLAGLLDVNAVSTGESGISGVEGIGGGGGIAMVGTALDSLVLEAFLSVAFRVPDRRPGGRDDLGLATSCEELPEVEGRLLSSDGRGRGPSLTLGFEYCA